MGGGLPFRAKKSATKAQRVRGPSARTAGSPRATWRRPNTWRASQMPSMLRPSHWAWRDERMGPKGSTPRKQTRDETNTEQTKQGATSQTNKEGTKQRESNEKGMNISKIQRWEQISKTKETKMGSPKWEPRPVESLVQFDHSPWPPEATHKHGKEATNRKWDQETKHGLTPSAQGGRVAEPRAPQRTNPLWFGGFGTTQKGTNQTKWHCRDRWLLGPSAVDLLMVTTFGPCGCSI